MSPAKLRGQLDKIVDGAPIFGWALMLDELTGTKRVKNTIRITNFSDFTTEVIAEVERPDVAAIFECDPQCGFMFAPPKDLIARGDTTLTFTVEPEGFELKNSPVLLSAAAKEAEDTGSAENKTSGSSGREPFGVVEYEVEEEQGAKDAGKILFSPVPLWKIFGASQERSQLRKKLGITSSGKAGVLSGQSSVDAVSEHFDRSFYLQVHDDVRASNVDPLDHYKQIGWREHRRPTPWFDTGYYLEANPDVRGADIDPFWHFLVVGRHEGRRSRRIGGRRRQVIENLTAPEDRTRSYVRQKSIRKMLPAVLNERLDSASACFSGLALVIGHDSYLSATGGIQIFTADEQRAFYARGVCYLHLSPVDPDLVLAKPEARSFYRIALNGAEIGIFSHKDVVTVLSNLPAHMLPRRIFIIHSLLGHNVDRVIDLQRELDSLENYFWLHDYTSICTGFNLLRDDVEFCHAPPVNSLSCLICIYGRSRPAHVSEITRLFDAVPIIVLAPSEAALKIWTQGTQLPHKGAHVHEHCKLERNAVRMEEPSNEPKGDPNNPVKVAFIGFPSTHKGWYIFENLLDAVSHMKCYRFFHFVADLETQHLHSQVTRITTRTSATHRDAMIDAIAAHDIDVVLVLAPWPETFSYVTFEAFAAGADVIALADSGNVAAAIIKNSMGLVVHDEEILISLFSSLGVVAYVRARRDDQPMAGSLVYTGTTATFQAPAE